MQILMRIIYIHLKYVYYNDIIYIFILMCYTSLLLNITFLLEYLKVGLDRYAIGDITCDTTVTIIYVVN